MFRVYKEVSALPGNLQPNAMYAVRVGAGFDLYITNAAGVPFSLNLPDGGGVGVIDGTLLNPPVSARLGVLNGNPSARPFTNYFKQAYPWEADSGGTNWDALVAGGYMTAGGQLISIAPGSNGFRTRLFDRAPAETGMSGNWRLQWDGTATVDIYGVASVNRDVPNQLTFNFTADGNSWADFVVRTINPAGGQIRNFRLVHEDDWEAHDAGQIYRQQFLDEIRNYRCLRFDEWIGILTGEDQGGLRITTWESRGLPSDEIFYRFVPYEWMIELCDLVGADCWVCLPTAATDDHFIQAATLFRDMTPAHRRVYAEYSTKTWDFSGTPQAHYTAEQGRIAFGTTANPTQQEFRSWYGMRSCQMAQAWRSVWGASPRLRTVIQTQADWLNSEDDVLIAPMWRDRDGTLGLPPYVAPHTVIDMLTVHAQIDGGLAYHTNDALIETWRTTLTQTEAFDRMRNQLLTAQYWLEEPDHPENNRNVANMTMKWNHFRTAADNYGLELGIYEVGNHLNGVGSSQAQRDFIAAFSVSPQMGEVYTAIFNALETIGLEGPLCFSVDTRYPDPNIVHGLQRWLGDRNPAWQAVAAFNAANTGPSGRGEQDFVGSIELTGEAAPGVDLTPILTRLDAAESAATALAERVETLENRPAPAQTFTTDAAAQAYSVANPGVAAFSTQAS